MNTEQLWNRFYAKLGNLCYAIAACDKKVTPAEIQKVKELVKKDWVNLESSLDPYGSDAAYQIEIFFEWLEENNPSYEVSFEEFSDFARENPQFFIPVIKERVIKTADRIAAAFAGKNKSELTLLFKLHKVLNIKHAV